MNLATRIFARAAVVALVAMYSAAFFAGCGKKDEGGDSGAKKEAAEKGKKDFQKGLEAVKAEKFDEAFKRFEKASNDGNTDATILLAYCYETGKGVEKDEAKAIELARKFAANACNVKGEFTAIYLDGKDGKIGKKELIKKIIELEPEMLKLAEANDPIAQMYYLAILGVKANTAKSREEEAKVDEVSGKWEKKVKESGLVKLFD